MREIQCVKRINTAKSLARTSKTPGRTQLINLFEVEEGVRLVDLPGYGYAEVPEEMKRKWQQALGEYLQKRECIKAGCLNGYPSSIKRPRYAND